ncbi:protein STICHEL-like 2 [Selaginella moellendorffii]|nr:protein STICHEL-like 2 [Selaginella moellendorffii]XP_024522566.1 protein STICHEL-like 2 [Selaginella moellendorffii]XP_024522567.1 protein STICHEL-like 2 [Selaginella moellendorffii]|eukprot:XP_024522565.1 protein STICHEL-like 2 [Selaginella moellendorffii]
MGNEYHQSYQQGAVHNSSKAKSQFQRQPQQRVGAPDPLLRELSALSRAPSLRDPSTSSVWKSGLPPQHNSTNNRLDKELPARLRGREAKLAKAAASFQGESVDQDGYGEEEIEQDQLRTEWQDKVVNWIDGGLREGERKQALLRSISEILNQKMDAPDSSSSANTKLRKIGSLEHQRPPQNLRRNRHQKEGGSRRGGRIAWREQEEEGYELEKALAVTRHEADPGYDYEESDSSSDDETDGLVSHLHSPLLAMQKERRVRRHRKLATGDLGCANFGFSMGSHPYKKFLPRKGHEADAYDGTEGSHGCGLPWSYWPRHKGKNLLEVAGKSLSCYPDIPRRKITGQEMIPAPGNIPVSANTDSAAAISNLSLLAGSLETDLDRLSNGKRHRSLSQKYRPKTFRDIVGQNMLVQALGNAVTRGRIAPVYLFHGPRGTGKTSAAKILAAALNCVSVEDTRPCGVCRECLLLCLGKSGDVKEVDVASHDSTSLMKKLLMDAVVGPSSGRYKVFIIDECHTLTAEGWNVFLKCLEEPPEHAVFILTTTDTEQLPHPASTRCQKFHFPKIKDSDVVSRLQALAAKESLEVEKDALDLIAARSGGSLRDAETTLDQLSLVGQKITLEVVQELVGLVSNAKLADLLDMALTGDTLNTVKCIREFMDAGVEPLALMSQIATLITDILAGGYMPASDKGFFHKHALSKDQLEKLRHALKTLSESEKQIRSSQDQTTWLTAALLQFAPDPHSGFPGSSGRTSNTPSILAANDTSEKETIEWEPPLTKESWDDVEHQHQAVLSGHLNSLQIDAENNLKHQAVLSGHLNSLQVDAENNLNGQDTTAQQPSALGEGDRVALERQQKLLDTWIRVLEVSQSSILKQLLWNHSRLSSISIEGGRAVAHLEFLQADHRTSAERSKTSISHAFQLVLGFPVEIRLHLSGDEDTKSKSHEQKLLPVSAEFKVPASPAKSSVPQAEYLNSRSFPVFIGNVKREGDEFPKGSWDFEDFSHRKSGSSENHSENDGTKGWGLRQQGRQMLQIQGRRFKLKTVRNFSTDLCSEAGQHVESKNQKPSARQKQGASLLCWKTNKVDEDDEEEAEQEAARP